MTRATWRSATQRALYGDNGFFLRSGAPGRSFRTAVTGASTAAGYACMLMRLLDEVDEGLDRPHRLDVVDVGAGAGELLLALRSAAPASLRARLVLHGVELADRPPGLPGDVSWGPALPRGASGLLVANEWLDNVPLDVVEQTADGPRVVLVEPGTGAESPGPTAPGPDRTWLADWWPLDDAQVGDRAEVGRPRDDAWADAVASLAGGVALAVDYGHLREERAAGLLAAGTLAGYRAGRPVAPVPDGSCDITAHVALDACAAAGARAGATATVLTSQRAALRALGAAAGTPAYELATRDPLAYLRGLQRAGVEAELVDPGGLGGFGWLAQAVGIALPPSLRRLPSLLP